jgi:hypothetical protein
LPIKTNHLVGAIAWSKLKTHLIYNPNKLVKRESYIRKKMLISYDVDDFFSLHCERSVIDLKHTIIFKLMHLKNYFAYFFFSYKKITNVTKVF